MKFIKQGLLAAGVALSLGAVLPASAQTTVTVLSHKVHENVARGLVAGTTGGDVAGEWAKANNVTLNWVTGNIDPIHDRLGRELSLSESSVDLAFVINKFHTPRIAALLEPLDEGEIDRTFGQRQFTTGWAVNCRCPKVRSISPSSSTSFTRRA